MNEPDIFLRNRRAGYELAPVACALCRRCWIRQVPVGANVGNWLCPRGWSSTCRSTQWERVERPEVLSAYLLTGAGGFGDIEGLAP